MNNPAFIHRFVLEEANDGDYACRAFPRTAHNWDSETGCSSGYALCEDFLYLFGITGDSPEALLVDMTTQYIQGWTEVTFPEATYTPDGNLVEEPACYLAVNPYDGEEVYSRLYSFKDMVISVREAFNVPVAKLTLYVRMRPLSKAQAALLLGD